MGVIIDKEKCIGCGRCIGICPGNIIRRAADKTVLINDPSDCWNCTSCMKECPTRAIYMFQSPESGGCGARMMLKQSGKLTEWIISKADGSEITIVTDTSESNKY